MTPEQREERRKRLEERMATMTPEERAAFQERMAQRQNGGGGRGGFGGGQGQFGNAPGGGQPGSARQSASAQGTTRSSGIGRVASTPSMAGSATTIDSLFGPLPVVETRGAAWIWENKQLKQVRLRLGATDGTNIEIIESTPAVHEGAEVVTNVVTEQSATTGTPGGNPANNPLLGPQRGRGGPGGGGGNRGGGR
jgi:hypothetical protein